ncbi:MAG: 23S rRNA (adenine(2503)-C(2))-methyltransferase RlmN, partial [Chlamydiia bacterium]|nr:23S rRNA (adenine(2503)-C(2))-methyltransferase RlmN [Chlamydiia bacterium]
MRAFCGQFGKELTPFFEEIEEKPFRLKQVFDWVYQKGILTYDGMRNLPLSLREKLSEALPLGILKIVSSEDSGDGETKKFLWKLHDGKLVESVLISSGERRTVCVSSQVGCPARCAFCASGKQGLIRHLSAAEIVEQVVHIN